LNGSKNFPGGGMDPNFLFKINTRLRHKPKYKKEDKVNFMCGFLK
jgi:hypothetical protein